MSNLKRFPIKYIRDYIKKDYKTREDCYICGSKTKLELHHLYSVSELFGKWCDKNGIKEVNSVEKIKELNDDVPIIMISGHGNIETAVNSIKQGAYDFVEKPFDGDIIVFKIKKALETYMPAIGLTDLSNLFGAVKFFKSAVAAGIKPIFGADVWIENDASSEQPHKMLLLCQKCNIFN